MADVRIIDDGELRISGEGGARKIVGYAPKWNQWSRPLRLGQRRFIERFAPGAFAGRDAEVVALYGHEKRSLLPLGNTKSGTLRVDDDGKGQAFELEPPDTAFARDLLVSIERGDVSDTSFGFALPENDREADKWQRGEGGIYRRTIHRATQQDVSIVARGAYAEADLAVRDAGESLDVFLAVKGQVVGHPNQRFINRWRGWGW